MFYSVTASGGKRFIINLNLVQRIEIFDRSLCLFYNTPHVSGLLSNKMHYKLIYFCPKTDVRKIYDEILGSLAEKGILIENKKELK
jgi:hypothetical protein